MIFHNLYYHLHICVQDIGPVKNVGINLTKKCSSDTIEPDLILNKESMAYHNFLKKIN